MSNYPTCPRCGKVLEDCGCDGLLYPPPPKGSWHDFGGEDRLRSLQGYSKATAKKLAREAGKPEKETTKRAKQIASELLKKARK